MFHSRSATFRPHRMVKDGSKEELQKYVGSSLDSCNLSHAVQLPDGVDMNEWIAVNIFNFYTQIKVLYNVLGEFCTEKSCPLMNAGPKYEYQWKDDGEYKKATPVSAPRYMELLMAWIQSQLDDPVVFPQKVGAPFPPSFQKTAKNICRRLFRVFSHVYNQHFGEVVQLGLEAHMNTVLTHYVYFIREFSLVDKKEMAPLQVFIDSICGTSKK